MEASSATAQSMHHITNAKLTALSKQQKSYEAKKKRIHEAVAEETTPSKKVRVLLDAFAVHEIEAPAHISISNVIRFMEQWKHDSSVSLSLIHDWQLTLEQALDVPSRKYEHALLFGRLVTEWLANPNDTPLGAGSRESGDSFEHIGRKEMHDQRETWESLVFDMNIKSDPAAIEAYLGKLFGSTSKSTKLSKTPLETMRESINSFHPGKLTVDVLKLCITTMLKTDMLSKAKRTALGDFRNNSMILQEMVDVLNLQLDALDSWSWGDGPVNVEVRRALNGKYRVYMDEEIIQALLLHFVGMSWAVYLKIRFNLFFHSGAWQQSTRSPMDGRARLKRQNYGLDVAPHESVRNERQRRYNSDYFMPQLPSSFHDVRDQYNDERDEDKGDPRNAIDVKQSLLHLISAETAVNTQLHGSFTVLQSDFKWFGPSLPHSTILTVLRFFGVSAQWLKFIEKFLVAPLKFVHDGPNAQTQIRRCGVPIQHRLADALGEAVLFCLDFAVNQSTQTNLHRMHDDLWFWGSLDASIKAWQTIQEFSAVMGLALNKEKTGSVHILHKTKSAFGSILLNKLPHGRIRWGFLILDSTGQWQIDDEQVEGHIRELRTQLEACKSIFAWVQAWNIYVARFMANNFGEPAICLGRPHIDMALEAFEKIQQKLFDTDDLPSASVTEHLRGKLAVRFGTENMPDGFFYFPVETGGLGLRNPFIPLMVLRKFSSNDPTELIDRALELEKDNYNKLKKQYEEGNLMLSGRPPSLGEFISFGEYMQCPEETSQYLKVAYETLLRAPAADLIKPASGASTSTIGEPCQGFNGPYYQWLFQLYGSEIVRRFGGLSMGEKRLLPIGLIDMLKEEKIKWQV